LGSVSIDWRSSPSFCVKNQFSRKAGRVLYIQIAFNLLGKENPMPEPSPKNKLTYFQRDQLSFFVTHPGQDQPNENQVAALINNSIKILGNLGHQTLLEPQSVYSFPKVSKRTYDSKLDEKRRPDVTPRPESSLISATISGASDNPIDFFQSIIRLDQDLRQEDLMGLTLGVVSPDWLVSSTPEGSGSGGPGGWPVPYRGSPERAPFRFTDLPEIVTKGNRGEGVDVIILDTAITEEEQVRAYNECQDWHPLIHSLLRPGGPLSIFPLPQPQRDHIAELRTFGHNYKMSDHGLFAAGIIHTIAPCARIYLVEVLNSYGVGDLDSIGWGLGFAIQHIQNNQDRKVVVNCSLCLDLPIDEQHCHTIPAEDNCFFDLFTKQDRDLEEQICIQLREDSDWFKNQKLSLEGPCDVILDLKSRVIAAAGNDHRPGKSVAPQARYPAALKSVQGVGALPKTLPRKNGKLKTASYSNQADAPRNIGITTLGGEEGEGQGMLGLYLGEFPCGDTNCTKWAWWSGTSFATPVVTGVTAAVLSDMTDETQGAIERLYEPISINNPRRIVVDGDAEHAEDGLSMVQS
jgi:hypothetical protein